MFLKSEILPFIIEVGLTDIEQAIASHPYAMVATVNAMRLDGETLGSLATQQIYGSKPLNISFHKRVDCYVVRPLVKGSYHHAVHSELPHIVQLWTDIDKAPITRICSESAYQSNKHIKLIDLARLRAWEVEQNAVIWHRVSNNPQLLIDNCY